MLSLIILLGLALAFLFTYVVLSIRDLRVPRLAFYTMLAGVLIANKGFATIGLGPLFIMDALVGLSLLGVLVNQTGRGRLIRSRIAWLVLAGFLIVGCVALVRGRAHGLNAVMDSVITFYAVAALVPVALFPTIAAARAFITSLAIPAAIGATFFVALSAFGPTADGFQSSVLIALGPLVYTGGTASDNAAASLVLLIALYGRLTPARIFMALVFFGAIVISFSRSVWVGLAVAGLILLLVAGAERGRIVRIAAVAVWVGLASFVFLIAIQAPIATAVVAEAESLLFKQNAAIADNPVANSKWRLTAWSETWDNRIRKHLLFGEGFGRPALQGTTIAAEDVTIRNDPRVQLHNGYLTYLLREGIVGLALFLTFVLVSLQRCISASRRANDPADRLFALGVVGAAVIYLVDIAFAVTIEGPMAALPFWSLIGIAYAVATANARSAVRVREAVRVRTVAKSVS